MRRLFLLLAMCIGVTGLIATGNAQDAPKKKNHGRGHHLLDKDTSAALHAISNRKYGHLLKALPKATQATYDAYQAPGGSCIPPIGDQGQCGDCYCWSGMKVCSAAQMTAGVVKAGSGFMLSVQWANDYHPELGGCDGGDEYQVAQVVLSGGSPSVTDYPGAGQGPGQKKPTTGMTLYTVSSLVYVDPTQTNQGIASTQSIKNAILAYGYVSVAVAAGDDWDNYTNGTLVGTNTQINHAVGATGWDDNHDNGDGSKGAFLGDNQWGTSWGNNGRFWIKYGADGYGTEAFVALVTPVPPTPPPPPVPPVPPTPPPPVPPAPPLPPSPPLPSAVSITLTTDQVQSVIAQSGVQVVYSDMKASDFLKVMDLVKAGQAPAPPGLGRSGPPPAREDSLVPAVSAPVLYQSPVYYTDSGAGTCANGSCSAVPQRRGLLRRW